MCAKLWLATRDLWPPRGHLWMCADNFACQDSGGGMLLGHLCISSSAPQRPECWRPRTSHCVAAVCLVNMLWPILEP